jgi:hypothetical protein
MAAMQAAPVTLGGGGEGGRGGAAEGMEACGCAFSVLLSLQIEERSATTGWVP